MTKMTSLFDMPLPPKKWKLDDGSVVTAQQVADRLDNTITQAAARNRLDGTSDPLEVYSPKGTKLNLKKKRTKKKEAAPVKKITRATTALEKLIRETRPFYADPFFKLALKHIG